MGNFKRIICFTISPMILSVQNFPVLSAIVLSVKKYFIPTDQIIFMLG